MGIGPSGDHGDTADAADNLPLGRPDQVAGRGVTVVGVGGDDDAFEAAPPAEPDRYLRETLDPLALATYHDLLLNPDPKVRRQAASDIVEMTGRKGRPGASLGGLHFNLAPDRATKLIEGLSKVFGSVGRADGEVIDV